MNPIPDVRLTVVVDHPVSIYSGMVPGFVAGQYSLHELEIDVRPLAKRAGARFIRAAATRIDAANKRIELTDRPALTYDIASINIGSTVIGTDLPGVKQFAFPTRPIADMCRRLDASFRNPPRTPGPEPYRVTVVGAGAGGVELAFCLRERLLAAGHTGIAVTLVAGGDRPMPTRPARLGDRIIAAAKERGIRWMGGRRVVEVQADAAVLDDGQRIESDLVIWVAGATGKSLFTDSELPTDDQGFVWVDDTLQVETATDLFAAGDCAVLRSWPLIPKAGVYAVRQGPVLGENLRRRAAQQSLQPYSPQSDFFTILNLGDGTAIGAKWGMAAEGAWMMQWKDRIDRAFMDKFQVLDLHGQAIDAFSASMPNMAEMTMVCGGCAAKVADTPLRRALARLPPTPDDDTVTMGLSSADDAVAVRRGDVEIVQNIDAFTAFTDDPWLVGRVGSLNAMSDLYATGVQPRYALAIVTIPEDEQNKEETLFQVLSGVRQELDAEGITLLGGHTTVGEALMVGLSVTGFAKGPLWRNDGLKPGHKLVLSRALGTGVLWHADMAGRARGPWMQQVVASMLRGNARAFRAIRDCNPSGVTDITGFGFAGHASEMLRGSVMGARIDLASVPALPGALELLATGERSTFHDQNREALKALRVPPNVDLIRLELLFDPQTAGGLLIGIAPDQAEQLVAALHEAGDIHAAVIGEVTLPDPHGALFDLT